MNSCMMCVCVCLLPISHKMLVSKCDRWTQYKDRKPEHVNKVTHRSTAQSKNIKV